MQQLSLTPAHVVARMDMGPALPVQDVACQYELSVSPLGAKSLGLRVSTVLGRTNTFLMSE